jgi:hypothetical protein
MSFANNGAEFPITKALASIHNYWSLINIHFVRQLATMIIDSLTLLSLLQATQVAIEVAPCTLVR